MLARSHASSLNVSGFRHIRNPEQLNRLKQFPLQRRRFRGDLFKTVNTGIGFVLFDPSEFVFLRDSRELRSHTCILAKSNVNIPFQLNICLPPPQSVSGRGLAKPETLYILA